MDFDAAFKKKANLSGSRGAREQSSAQVLNQAKQERAARQHARQRQRAASTLARWWRGSTARGSSRRQLRQEWLQQYSGTVSQAQLVLPAVQMTSSVLPPVLLAYLPAAGQQQQRQALLAGGALPLLLLADTAALRGCFALLLRSLAAADQEHNLLGLAAAGAAAAAAVADSGDLQQHQQVAQAQLLGQLKRLLLLCCSIIGGSSSSDSSSSSKGSTDALLQAAAGRVVGVLCDSSLWKCFPPVSGQQQQQGQQQNQQQPAAAGQQWLQQGLLSWLAPLPLLAAAAQRLAAGLVGSPAAAGGSGEQQQQQQKQQQQGDLQRQQLTAVLNGLVVAQLKVWRQLQAAASAPSSAAAAEAAAGQLLRLLATPGLLPLLAPGTATQLTAAPGFAALLEAAAAWQPASSSSGGGGDALCLLGTLAQLAAGRKVSKQQSQQQQQQQQRQVDFLPSSVLLQQQGVAAALGAAATSLLLPAPEGPTSSASSGGGSGFAAAAGEQLWPFAEGTFAAQLLALLPLPQFLQLYHLLLLLADSSGSSGSGSRVGQVQAARLLSALAFGTRLLPLMWRQLATSIGLPLEAPMQATRGWEVPTLRRGIAGLHPEAAAQLGLFCRVYCHHLMVVDDYEFHEKQQPFNLGQQRAIAAALNTLVFRTQLPDAASGSAAAGAAAAAAGAAAAAAAGVSAGPGGSGGGGRGGKLGREYGMLQQAAPLLHRALYERDARRQFCPAALWLEPYQHLVSGVGGSGISSGRSRSQQQAQAQGQPTSGAAVVRALLAAVDDSTEGQQQQQQQQQMMLGPAGAGAAAAAGSASRPAAVAAILTAAPQCVPFDERVAVFRALVDSDQARCGYHLSPVEGGARPLPITIRRTHVLEDAAAQLGRLGGAVKSRLNLTFYNQQGLQEAGIDLGGLMKEFLESVVAAGFDPNRGLFSATPDGYAYPHPLAERLDGGLPALETLGLVLGRALYEGVLLDLPLAPFFVSRLQGRWPLFDEVQALDPEVYRSLMQLKRYEGAVQDLALDFTVESDFLGSTISEELVPGGSRLAVTNENVLQYVYLVADWHLNKRLGPAAAAFSRGLSKVIPAAWLRLFSPHEVNQLLGGGDAAALDVDDMQAHTQYSNGYSASSTAVKHFWQVVRALSQEEQRCLLKFVTSCSRAPLGGFQHLTPPFTLHKVDCGASLLAAVGGKDVDRLPTASTCTNTLKLPNFRRAATLREKLLYAIKAGAGFELS